MTPETLAKNTGPGLKEMAIALFACFLLACLITYPTIFELGTSILGHERCTNLMHVWTYWAVHQALQDQVVPIVFDYIFFPVGGNLIRLYGSDLLYPVLFAPLQWLTDPGTIFNLKILLSMTVAPFGVYRLLRYSGVSFAAALAGGAFFITTPYFMLETLNGVAELVAVEWIPFAAFYLLRTLELHRYKDAALTVFFAILSVYASAYSAFFFALFAVVAITHDIFYGKQKIISKKRILIVLMAVSITGVGMLPFVLLHQTGKTASSLQAKEKNFTAETAAPTADASADLVRFFRPGRNTIPEVFVRKDGGRDEVYTTYTTYIGFGILALALVAVRRRSPRIRVWIWSALFFFSIALGPYLRVLGEPVTIAGEGIPLPSLLFYHYFPGFSVTARHTYRYVTMLHLSLAILAGFGLQNIFNHLKTQSSRIAASILLPAIAIGEILVAGPAPWPIPKTHIDVPDFYYEMAKEEQNYGVIELPFTRNHLRDLQRYLYYQTVHEKKWIDGGMHFRTREGALDYVRSVPLSQNFLAEHTISRPLSESMTRFSTRMFQKRGYRYVIIHDQWFEEPDEAGLAHTFLQDLYGEPIVSDGDFKVYAITMKDDIKPAH